MPKKIPINEKMEWLEEYEEGKLRADIARERGRTQKVINSGIKDALTHRDGIFARKEIVKEALKNHQKQLMEVIRRLIRLTEDIPADIELRREKEGSLAPIPLPAGRIVYNTTDGLKVVLSDELTPYWGLLKEHLRIRKIWTSIDGWKRAAIDHMHARRNLELGIQFLVERETGIKVATSEPMSERDYFIYPFTVKLFYEVSIRKILGIRDETNLQDSIVATSEGYVLHGEGGSKLAYSSDRQQECRDALIEAFNGINGLPEAKKVTSTDIELKRASTKLKGYLEDIDLMGIVPGRCRICSRIGM